MIKNQKATKIQHNVHFPVTIEDIDRLYEFYRLLMENTLVCELNLSLKYILSFKCRLTLTKNEFQVKGSGSSELSVTTNPI